LRAFELQDVALRRLWAKAREKRAALLTLGNLGVAEVLLIVLGIGSNSILARGVSPAIYGEYQLVLSFVGIVSSFCLTGLSESLTISAARRYDGNLLRITGLNLAVTVLGALALAGVAVYYRSSQPTLSLGVAAAALLFPLGNLATIWPPWLIGRGRLGLNAGLQVALSAIGVGALAVFALLQRIALTELVLMVMGLQAVFSLVVVLCLLARRTSEVSHPQTVVFGLHATVASLLGGLVLTDKLIINSRLSAADVAIYTVALVFPTQIKSLYGVFNQMLAPAVYKAGSVAAAWKYLRKRLAVLVVVFTAVGAVGFVAIPVFVPLLFSQRYAVAVPYGKWLWLSLAVTAPATYLANVLRAQRKVRFVYVSSLGMPVVAFALYLALVRYGLAGIVVAKIVSQWCAVALYVGAFLYHLRQPSSRGAGVAAEGL